MPATAPTVEPVAERIKAVTGDQPVTSGAKLVRVLKVSGTPDARLAAARAALLAANSDLPASEVIAAMVAADVSPATVAKARALAATGKLPSREASRPIEDVLLDPAKADAAPPKTWKADATKK